MTIVNTKLMVVATSTVLLISYGIAVLNMASQGYCFQQKRYLSDDEYLMKVFKLRNPIDGKGTTEASIRAYISAHPDCCQISKKGYLIPFRGETGLGFFDVYFDIYVEIDSSKKQYYMSTEHLSACGKKGSIFGMHVDSKPQFLPAS